MTSSSREAGNRLNQNRRTSVGLDRRTVITAGGRRVGHGCTRLGVSGPLGPGREARQDRLRQPADRTTCAVCRGRQFHRRQRSGAVQEAGLPIEIVVKDSQTNSNRAAEVAADLILKDKVALMVVGAAPETDNPVADQCELNEVPCVSTVSPWQPWFFARGGKPDKPFKWTYHYFWGLEDAHRHHPGHVVAAAAARPTASSVPHSPTIRTATPGETPSTVCRLR